MRRLIGTAAIVTALFAIVAAAQAVSIKSSYWKVSTTTEKKVANGKHVEYCSTQAISLMPTIVLRASIPQGTDYGYELVGPKAAGQSQFTSAGPSTGTGTVISPDYSAFEFSKLKNHVSLPPGRYTFELNINGKVTNKLTLTLVAKPGC